MEFEQAREEYGNVAMGVIRKTFFWIRCKAEYEAVKADMLVGIWNALSSPVFGTEPVLAVTTNVRWEVLKGWATRHGRIRKGVRSFRMKEQKGWDEKCTRRIDRKARRLHKEKEEAEKAAEKAADTLGLLLLEGGRKSNKIEAALRLWIGGEAATTASLKCGMNGNRLLEWLRAARDKWLAKQGIVKAGQQVPVLP